MQLEHRAVSRLARDLRVLLVAGGVVAMAGCAGDIGGRDAGAADTSSADDAPLDLDTQIEADAAMGADAGPPDAGPPVIEACETAAALATPTDVTFGRIKPGAGVTNPYGGGHTGIDFAGGQPEVQASSDGFVIARRTSRDSREAISGFPLPSPAAGCWGNYVGILHGATSGGQVLVSWYAHLDSVHLALGQSVTRGDIVGVAGRTSYINCDVSGVHLHYSVTRDGAIVDPGPYYGTASGNATVSMRWHWAPPDAAAQQRIDLALSAAGYAAGTGSHWTPASIAAMQRVLTDYAGFTGAIDGTPSAATAEFVQRFAAGCGGYTGPINAVPGPNTWTGFEAALGAL